MRHKFIQDDLRRSSTTLQRNLAKKKYVPTNFPLIKMSYLYNRHQEHLTHFYRGKNIF
jgi:hypothetical protein